MILHIEDYEEITIIADDVRYTLKKEHIDLILTCHKEEDED